MLVEKLKKKQSYAYFELFSMTHKTVLHPLAQAIPSSLKT